MYLNTTTSHCLEYAPARVLTTSFELDICIFTDSDFAADMIDRKSVSGLCVFVEGNLLNWLSKRQVTTALSSTEAEYMALCEAVKEGLHVIYLLRNMFSIKFPVPIYIDNKAAACIAKNDVNNKRTKHIDVRYHFLREHVQNGTFILKYVPSADNFADLFTKCLNGPVFKNLSQSLLKPLIRDYLTTATTLTIEWDTNVTPDDDESSMDV